MQNFRRRRSQLTAKHLQPEPIVAARWRRMPFHALGLHPGGASTLETINRHPQMPPHISALSLLQEHAKRPPPPEEMRIEISVVFRAWATIPLSPGRERKTIETRPARTSVSDASSGFTQNNACTRPLQWRKSSHRIAGPAHPSSRLHAPQQQATTAHNPVDLLAIM